MRRWASLLVGALMALMVATVVTPAGTQPASSADRTQQTKRDRKARKRLAKLRKRILRKKVGLDDEQIAQVTRILREQQQARRPVEKRIRKARAALGKLLKADSADQQAFAAHLDDYQAGLLELAKLRDQQVTALRAVLPPDKQAKLFRAMELVKKRLDRRRKAKRRQRRNRR